MEIAKNKLAVGGIFLVASSALVGLAIWLSPGVAQPAEPGIAPAGAEVSAPALTTVSVVATSPGTGVSQALAASSAATTTKPGQKAPAQVQATNEPVPTTTQPPAPPVTTTATLAPGQSSPPPPEPQCRMVYDDPQRYPNGRVVCDP